MTKTDLPYITDGDLRSAGDPRPCWAWHQAPRPTKPPKCRLTQPPHPGGSLVLRPLKPFVGCSELRLRCFSLYNQTAHVVPQPILAENRYSFCFRQKHGFLTRNGWGTVGPTELYARYGCRGPWVTVTYGPQHPYSSYSSLGHNRSRPSASIHMSCSSYSSLGPTVSRPFLAEKHCFLVGRT
jgi:hypothetical protein